MIFLVHSNHGIPIDACLSPAARAYLQTLAVAPEDLICQDVSTLAKENVTDEEEDGATEHGESAVHQAEDKLSRYLEISTRQAAERGDYHRVEVPLRYDHEFFQMLKSGLSRMNTLQTDEKAELTKEIGRLGQAIAKVAAPSQTSASPDMYVWRDIFSLYTNSQVFFSTSEQDEHTRDIRTAEKQLQDFSTRLQELSATHKFRRKESYLALDRFLHLNLSLLRNLRFEELNTTAMTKILKSKY